MKKEFLIIQDKFPFFSTYICYVKLIWGNAYKKSKVRLWFNKLVERDDYSKEEKKEVLEFLYRANSVKKG